MSCTQQHVLNFTTYAVKGHQVSRSRRHYAALGMPEARTSRAAVLADRRMASRANVGGDHGGFGPGRALAKSSAAERLPITGGKVSDSGETSTQRVLHVVVGHGIPTYFLNTVRSVRATAPNDPVLVIDNASPQAELRSALKRMADEDPLIDLVLRSKNDLRRNRKVEAFMTPTK